MLIRGFWMMSHYPGKKDTKEKKVVEGKCF